MVLKVEDLDIYQMAEDLNKSCFRVIAKKTKHIYPFHKKGTRSKYISCIS